MEEWFLQLSYDNLTLVFNICRSIEAQQAAAAAAAKINQQLGVSQNKPMIPGMPSPPGPKPGMPGLGMVVTEDYTVPDKLVGLSKYSVKKKCNPISH